MTSAPSNARPQPDRVLADIADYVLNYKIRSKTVFEMARLCMTDALACGLQALSYPECTKLLGPLVPGTQVPCGSRVPGTRFELDPATAAFNIGCMVRWLDYNDSFTAAQGTHPSDNLAGILAMADHLSRKAIAAGKPPLLMRSVLEALVKAYEIQGCIAIANNFQPPSIDHPLLTRVASTAVLTGMLGGTREEIINAVSNSWLDTTLVVFRQAPNTGWRKSWSVADASFNAVRLAMMSLKGEMGYPSVLTAKRYGFYAARYGGQAFKFERPYRDYIIRHSMFKFVPAGIHSQSAIECALRLHATVKDRIADISRIVIHSQRSLMGVMDKKGPLHNPADRDHCAQYVVAIALLFGRLTPQDFEDDIAADARIDALREKMEVTEDPRYTRDFVDPAKRSSANAIQIFFRDGSHTQKIEIEYPVGHPRRRKQAAPALRSKFESALASRYPRQQVDRILAVCDDSARLQRMPVNEFIELLLI